MKPLSKRTNNYTKQFLNRPIAELTPEERQQREAILAEQDENRQTARLVFVFFMWFFALIIPMPLEAKVVIAMAGAFLAIL